MTELSFVLFFLTPNGINKPLDQPRILADPNLTISGISLFDSKKKHQLPMDARHQ